MVLNGRGNLTKRISGQHRAKMGFEVKNHTNWSNWPMSCDQHRSISTSSIAFIPFTLYQLQMIALMTVAKPVTKTVSDQCNNDTVSTL